MCMARPWVRGDLDHPSCIHIYLGRTMLCSLPVRVIPGVHVRLSKWWIDNCHLSKHAIFDFLTMTWKMLTHREILTIMWALQLTPVGWGTWEINCSFFSPKGTGPHPQWQMGSTALLFQRMLLSSDGSTINEVAGSEGQEETKAINMLWGVKKWFFKIGSQDVTQAQDKGKPLSFQLPCVEFLTKSSQAGLHHLDHCSRLPTVCSLFAKFHQTRTGLTSARPLGINSPKS